MNTPVGRDERPTAPVDHGLGGAALMRPEGSTATPGKGEAVVVDAALGVGGA